MRAVSPSRRWSSSCVAFFALVACKPAPAPAPPAPPRVIALEVTAKGFEPAELKLAKGERVVFHVTRRTDDTCATELTIDGTELEVKLPLNETVQIPYTAPTSGKISYGCAMQKMIGGVLLVE